jgi:ferredoxin
MLVINPDECIDCGVCEPECPAEAIKPESESVVKWMEINRQYATLWPNLNSRKDPLPEADDYRDIPNKFEKFFSDKPGAGNE